MPAILVQHTGGGGRRTRSSRLQTSWLQRRTIFLLYFHSFTLSPYTWPAGATFQAQPTIILPFTMSLTERCSKPKHDAVPEDFTTSSKDISMSSFKCMTRASVVQHFPYQCGFLEVSFQWHQHFYMRSCPELSNILPLRNWWNLVSVGIQTSVDQSSFRLVPLPKHGSATR